MSTRTMQHKREWYIPKGARKIAAKNSDAVAYIYETPGKSEFAAPYSVVAFHGRAQKPDFDYYYKTPEQREKAIREFFDGREKTLKFKAELRASRNKKRKLEVGHILYTSWGYDQTNSEFFEVTDLIGDTMVEVREIGCTSTENGSPSAQLVPKIGNYTGEPLRRKVSGYDGASLKIDNVRYAHLWSGKPVTITGAYYGH